MLDHTKNAIMNLLSEIKIFLQNIVNIELEFMATGFVNADNKHTLFFAFVISFIYRPQSYIRNIFAQKSGIFNETQSHSLNIRYLVNFNF